MNFRRKEEAPRQEPKIVDLEQLDRDLAYPGNRKPTGPVDYAQPHVREAASAPQVAVEQATNAALAAAVDPQVMSQAGALLQQAHKALADQVRKACADEVEHAKELQKKGEQVALELEETGKDLAVALSAQNNTVGAMFDEQKKYSARKANLREQIANGSNGNGKKAKMAEPPVPPEAA